jgi:diaminopimelate epimerase
MRFEKWQALGNDYAIVEEREVPFELTADRVRAMCAAHTGIGSDGLLVLAEAADSSFVADLTIFNPDGSRAELSGNGVRQAVMYLRRRGWAEHDVFSLQTPAGEVRPRITGPSTCTVDMGRVRVGGEGEVTSAGRTFRFQFVDAGNPQCAIELGEDLEELDLQRYGPEIENNVGLFPNRTNVSFWRREGVARIRARIFERGVGETMSSGTGAIGAAVAAVQRGAESPVTVRLDGGELEVAVGEDLHVDLTGWAVPVYEGRLSDELVAQLGERDGAG